MKRLKLSVLPLLFLTINSVSASTVIDSFNDLTMQYVSDGFSTSITSSTVSTNNALGGSRKISVTNNNGALASAKVKDGVFYHSAGAGTSATSTIVWDADGAGLNVDLLATDTLGFSGSSCFECFVLDVISIDQGNVDLTIQLDDGSNTASYTSSGVDTGIYEIMFSQFGTDINLSSIMAISLIVEGGVASDMSLDFQGFTGKQASALQNVNSVPLPATLWLLISAGLISYLSTYKKKLA